MSPLKKFEFNTEPKLKQHFQTIVTNRFANCALKAFEDSEYSTIVISSKIFRDDLGLNMTINVDLIQSFIPDFANDYSYDQEIVIQMTLLNNQITFSEKDQQIKVKGQMKLKFLTADSSDSSDSTSNSSITEFQQQLVYYSTLEYTSAFNISIESMPEKKQYMLQSKIIDIQTDVIRDPTER